MYRFLLFLLLYPPLLLSYNFNETAQDTPLYLQNPLYHQEISLYRVYKIKQADIVMLGNSNTHGVNWNELLGRPNVVERGVTSDILDGYLARIEYVIKLRPKICFISGGLNDIYNWISVEDIMNKYIELIDILQKNQIEPVVQSTFYVLADWPFAEDKNPEVTKLNSLLEEYCKRERMEFIDLTPITSRGGAFRKELTNAWGHLNGEGYRVWAEEVDKVLMKLGY
jgi:lysophospholipase L1-like esterase